MKNEAEAMVNGFVSAIRRAKEELKAQGFDRVEEISERILEKGGIRKELS